MQKYRIFQWNDDFEECREKATAGTFNTALARSIGQTMYQEYRAQLRANTNHKMGGSLSSFHSFCRLWTCDARIQHFSESDAKVLFLAASDVFQRLAFGGQTVHERREDLRDRMSRLSELSAELELHIQKLTDTDDSDALEAEYQELFAQTLRLYGK